MRLIIILLILLSSCSKPHLDGEALSSPIYNGSSGDEFPYVARLVDNVAGPFCSAVFIAPNKLLTAAHCIDYMNMGMKYIYVEASASYDHQQNNLQFQIIDKQANSFYSAVNDFSTPTNRFDFGVLKIDGKYNPGVPFPKLASAKQLSNLNSQTTVNLIGYGKREVDTESSYRYQIAQQIFGMDNEMLIAGKLYHGAFHGDSGGAIVIKKDGRDLLVGIIVSNYDDRDLPGITRSIRADRIAKWLKAKKYWDRKWYRLALAKFPWDHNLILEAADHFGATSSKSIKLYQQHLSKSCDNQEILKRILSSNRDDLSDMLYFYLSIYSPNSLKDDTLEKGDSWRIQLAQQIEKVRSIALINENVITQTQELLDSLPGYYKNVPETRFLETLSTLYREGSVDKKLINLSDNIGNNLLYYANKFVDNSCRIKMIELGANPHQANCRGITPFHFISKNPEFHLIKAMLQQEMLNEYQKELIQHYANQKEQFAQTTQLLEEISIE